MRKFAITLALASTALATPALARDGAWYVGIEGGPMILQDLDFRVNGVEDAQSVDSKEGGDFDGVVGYDFGGFRLEAEVGYKRAATDDVFSPNLTRPTSLIVFSPTTGALEYDGPNTPNRNLGGETTALSFMLNALADFGGEGGFGGFIGGGVGVARIKANDYSINGAGAYLDDSDSVFAFQGLAGIRAPLTGNIEASLKYRYFQADDVKLVDAAGRPNDTKFRSHSILGGLIFNFGGEAPPPPPEPTPPPPEPTPPPPPPAVCEPGPYIVFFEWDKSDITAESAATLDNAAAKYQTCGNAQVMLAGHADRSGSTTYNVGLSERRNAAVQSYLVGRGVPGGVITTQAFGESRPRVETADGVREVQNRRVEITYGPGSGM